MGQQKDRPAYARIKSQAPERNSNGKGSCAQTSALERPSKTMKFIRGQIIWGEPYIIPEIIIKPHGGVAEADQTNIMDDGVDILNDKGSNVQGSDF